MAVEIARSSFANLALRRHISNTAGFIAAVASNDVTKVDTTDRSG